MTAYDREAASLAMDRAKHDPLNLTADDLAQLALVSPEIADRARRAKALARDGRDPATGAALVSLDNAVRVDTADGRQRTASVEQPDPRTLAGAIAQGIGPLFRRLVERIATVEAAVGVTRTSSTASAKPHIRARGPWDPTVQYRPGDGVLVGTKAYVSDAHIIGQSPETSTCWRLLDGDRA